MLRPLVCQTQGIFLESIIHSERKGRGPTKITLKKTSLKTLGVYNRTSRLGFWPSTITRAKFMPFHCKRILENNSMYIIMTLIIHLYIHIRTYINLKNKKKKKKKSIAIPKGSCSGAVGLISV